MNRLFEVQPNGTLIEVTEEKRAGRRYATVNTTIDILFTAEQEAQRDTEEQVALAEATALAEAAQASAAARATAMQKLGALGLNQEDLKALGL